MRPGSWRASLRAIFVFGRALPWLVSVFVALISSLLAVHALLALRKFPADWAQYRAIAAHSDRTRHGDTLLWLVQVATGFAMFFLAPVHLYTMMTRPELIGPSSPPTACGAASTGRST